MTNEGWLHISLNTLLPSFRHKSSGYITDTIERLISEYKYELPYFEKAFLAIVEHVGYDNHNALDNDNKDWRMIPNVFVWNDLAQMYPLKEVEYFSLN